ncbi:MAG: lipopolysaccharide biosynthesis protein [Myxococcales bacterium]|nr:lipopolysaccharide biosynthesis protein [Myxococcales bacterium]
MKRRNLLYALSSGYLRMVIDFGAVIVLAPVIWSMWGDKGYGQWVVLLAWYQQITTFDLGLGMVIFRDVSATEKNQKPQTIDKLWSAVSTWSVGFGLFIFFIASFFSLSWYWMLLLFTACAMLPIRSLQMLLNGREDLAWSHAAYMTGRLFFVLGVLGLWFFGARNLGLLVSLFVISQWLEGLLLIGFVWRRHRQDRPRWQLLSLAQYKQIWKETAPFFSIGLASNVLGRIEPILLSTLFSYQIVAYYDLAFKLCVYFGVFCRQILNAWSPAFARSQGAAQEAILKALFWCGLVAWPFMSFALLHRDILFTAWIGEAPSLTLSLFVWLLLGTWVNVFQSILSNALALRGEQRIVAKAVLWRGVSGLLVAALVGWLWGPLGYAIALCIVGIAWDLGYITKVCAASIHIPAKKILEYFFVFPAVPLVGFWFAVGFAATWNFAWSPRIVLVTLAAWEVGAFALSAAAFLYFLRRSPWNPSALSPTSLPLSSKAATSC